MAWLEKKGRRYLLVFRLNGAKYKKLLVPTDQREAEAIAAKVERRIEMLQLGEWELPDPTQVAESLIGELAAKPKIELPTGKKIGQLIEEYVESVLNGSMESNTILTLRIHLGHVQRVLKSGFRVDSLTFAVLQDYINTRSKSTGRRGKPLIATTIRKELVSFGAMWTWATRMGYVKQPFPKQGLELP